jgi:hypothetical protein
MKSYLVILILFTTLVPTGASIASDSQKAGVLEIEVISGRQKHQRIASDMTRTLRSVIRGQRRWRDVGKLSATLSDARDAFGCEPQNTKCMQGLAQTLGVNVLVWGIVDGTGPVERIELWGVSADGVREYLNIPLNNSSPYVDYRSSAKKLLGKTIRNNEHRTQVDMTTEPQGAIIQINGENVGLSPVSLALREGTYKVELSLENYDLIDETLIVTRTNTLEKNWRLRPSSNTSPLHNSNGTSLRKTIRWSALGVALTSMAVTAYFTNEARAVSFKTKLNIDGQCNPESGDCEPFGLADYEMLKRSYQNSKIMSIGSLVLTGIAASVFGASFVF